MPSEVHDDLTGLQNALLNTDSIEQFLRELAVLAVWSLGDDVGSDENNEERGEWNGESRGSHRTRTRGGGGAAGEMACGMALRQRGRPQQVAACSDPLASEADRLQHQAQAGPVLDVLLHARPVLVRDTTADQRWPRFCRPAASLGIRSCYALPLVTDGEPVGSLVLYARRPGAFGPEPLGAERARRAQRFCRHASGALTVALRLATCSDHNDQLRSSIISRAVIDQALGVIMATQRCPQGRALELLRSVSQNTNVKVRDLAATIVSSVTGEPPKPTAPFEDD